VLLLHVDSLNQAPDDRPPCLKIGLLQPIVHFGGKGFQPAFRTEALIWMHFYR
jgi:hypothetical protein